MPELPDVEIFKKYLDQYALDQKIEGIEVFENKLIRGATGKEVEEALHNDSFTSSERYGKWLLVKTKKGRALAMHFGMTGKLQYLEDGDNLPSSTRFIIEFKGKKKLAFADRRKLGGIELVKNKEDLITKHNLGPDATIISWQEFKEALHKKSRKIKTVLIDQSILAGIGNVYADEILFQSKVHPETSAAKLEEKQLKEVFKNINPVLRTAIKHQGKRKSLPDHYIIPHRKEGADCPVCGGKIEVIEVGGRTTYFCPGCQERV